MKRLSTIMMCLFAIMAASLSAKAQEVTITLYPGWNWISYPKAEALDINTALGDFVPVNGDMIKAQFSTSSYINGYWRGGVTHFMPGWGYMYYSNRTEIVSFVFGTPAPQLIVTTAEPTEITTTSAMSGGSITSNDGSYIYVFMKGICWATHPNPMVMNDFYTENGNGAESFTAEMTDLSPNTVYYVRAYAVTFDGTFYGNELSFSTDHEYVDLGLPSGTLWATCNVGADNPEDYGDHFAWGEIQPKNIYNWNTYQYCNGSSSTLSKYCNNSSYGYNGFTDDLTALLPEDDVATANWGSGWRMPTDEEWQELFDYTTHSWATQNGVNGFLFTNNGNSFFLPAAGYCVESSIYFEGGLGFYLSNSLYTDEPDYAWGFGGFSSNYNVSYGIRNSGFSVRPVRSISGEAGSFTVTTFPSTDISYIADIEPCPILDVTVSLMYEDVLVDADIIPEGWTHVATGVYQRSLNHPGTVDEQIWSYTINGINGSQTITENSAARSLTAVCPAYWGIYPSNDSNGDITDIVASLAQQNRLTTDLPETTLEIPNPTDSTCWLWIVTKGTATAKTAIFDLNMMLDPVEDKQFVSPMPNADWELNGYKVYVSINPADAGLSFGNVKLSINL